MAMSVLDVVIKLVVVIELVVVVSVIRLVVVVRGSMAMVIQKW